MHAVTRRDFLQMSLALPWAVPLVRQAGLLPEASALQAGPGAPRNAEEAARSLAPTGRLRVAINLGNSVLAQRKPDGELTGVTVILAQALAKELRLPLEMTAYAAAGLVFDALGDVPGKGAWDVAFLAMEPERATRVDFSPPYLFIDGTYLVRSDGPYHVAANLDRLGAKIAVGRGAAYDLFLTRTLKKAELVRVVNGAAAMQAFVDGNLDAAAGVRQALVEFARSKPGLRVLPDSFQRIEQCIGVPKGRSAGAAYLRIFLERMKSSGELRRALDATGQQDAQIAGPARP